MNFRARDQDAFIPTYRRLNIEMESAQGVYIFDTNGKEYIDFISGLGVHLFGHRHPAIIDAVEAQLRKYLHVSNLFVQPAQIEVAEALRDMTGYERVYLSNSGAESIEACLKFVRKWGSSHGKDNIIACSNGFHGRTIGSLSLMDREKYRFGYEPFLNGITICPFNDPDALRTHVNHRTSAIFLEWIQGEGGIIEASQEFIDTIFELRRKFGFLVVADEIQIGVGRTGRFFGFNHWNVDPDVVAIAKAIGGGLPLGAILVHEELKDVFGYGGHGSTFGGNPLACAAGKAVLQLLAGMDFWRASDRIFSGISSAMETIRSRTGEFIVDVRGRGCLLGIEVRGDLQAIQKDCIAQGLVIGTSGANVLRLFPPLICTDVEIASACDILSHVLTMHAENTLLIAQEKQT